MYEQIFEHVTLIDSHCHVGKDIDGHHLTAANLLKQMDANGISRAIIFPLDDPQAGRDFHKPNERIHKAFLGQPERFIPFMRLNPLGSWKEELTTRVHQGFLGVKLHPRSQQFSLTSQEAMKLYERIENENLMVLIHAGFGLDYVAEEFSTIIKTFPKLKLLIGHGGFPDLQQVIKLFKGKENVVFETSTMRIFDLVELLKTVPYQQIAFGSDTPLYDQTFALQMFIDSAIMAHQPPGHIKSMLGETIGKWLK